MVHCNSSDQKLNTKISSETEVVKVIDFLPYNILVCFFMGVQGYDIKQNILFQHNKSEIKKQNGKKSCNGKSRHIDIYYFFATDQVERNNMSIFILQHREHACRLFHGISKRIPVC